MKTFTVENWMIFTINKPRYHGTSVSSRMTVKKPTLKSDERAVRIKTVLPESMFTIPEVSATLTVKASEVVVPDIEIEVSQVENE